MINGSGTLDVARREGRLALAQARGRIKKPSGVNVRVSAAPKQMVTVDYQLVLLQGRPQEDHDEGQHRPLPHAAAEHARSAAAAVGRRRVHRDGRRAAHARLGSHQGRRLGGLTAGPGGSASWRISTRRWEPRCSTPGATCSGDACSRSPTSPRAATPTAIAAIGDGVRLDRRAAARRALRPRPPPQRSTRSPAASASSRRRSSRARASARARIDLRDERGSHPHVGALDVAPVVYLDAARRGAACAEALVAGEELGRAGLPVFLYGELAGGRTRARAAPRRRRARSRERVAAGELRPDFGPPRSTRAPAPCSSPRARRSSPSTSSSRRPRRSTTRARSPR